LPSGAFTRYALTFSSADYSHEDLTLNDDEGSVDLEPGSWIISVTAYSGPEGDIPSGTGSAEVTVNASVSTPVSIAITPMAGTVQGNLTYTLTYPAGDYSVQTLTITNAAGTTIGAPHILEASGTQGTIALNPGSYFAHFVLEKSDTRTRAGWTTAVHIYPGKDTPAERDFTAGDFEALVPISGTASLNINLPEGVAVTAGSKKVLAYEDNACTTPVSGAEGLIGDEGGYLLFVPASYSAVYLRPQFMAGAWPVTVTGAAAQVSIPENVTAGITGQNLSATFYSVTIPSLTGGSISAPPAALADSTVTITVNTSPGYEFNDDCLSWSGGTLTLTPAEETSPPEYTFTMPEGNVSAADAFEALTVLTALSVTGGTLSPAFSPEITDYTVTTLGAITLNATGAAGTTVTYRKDSDTYGNTVTYDYTVNGVEKEIYTVNVKVTGADSSERVYTLKVREYQLRDTGPAGGLIFYIDEADDFPWTYLECAPGDTGNAQWGAYGTLVGTDTAIGTGQANTVEIITTLAGLAQTGRAAQLCDSYSIGEYSDWFLPSTDELALMYSNLTAQSMGSFGIDYYWSSSETGSGDAWVQRFSDGFQANSAKSGTASVRAVRAFPLAPVNLTGLTVTGGDLSPAFSQAVTDYTVTASGSITVTGTGATGTTVTYRKGSGSYGSTVTYNYVVNDGEPEIYTINIKASSVGRPETVYTLKVREYQLRDTGPAGGLIFYIDEADDFPWTYLECAPADAGNAGWGSFTYFEGTGTAIGTGQTNTNAIITALSGLGETGKAAQFSVDYSVNEYDDWFLPSKDELNLMYNNLAKQGMGGFSTSWYWSSSEHSASYAWSQIFSDDYQDYWAKSNTYSVRPVRAFPLAPVNLTGLTVTGGDLSPTFDPAVANYNITASGSITISGTSAAGTTVTYRKNTGSYGGVNTFDFATGEYDYTVTVKVSAADGRAEYYTVKIYRYAVGDTGPAGGWIFYIDEADDFPWTYLECAPADLGLAEWGAYGTTIGGTDTAIGTGQTNTTAIIDKLGELEESGKAAQLCDSYSVNGYSDWFLPSKDELNLMYTNLHAHGTGGFNTEYYWSSSEYSSNLAWIQRFSIGNQSYPGKYNINSVRAVRAFPLPPVNLSALTVTGGALSPVFDPDVTNYSITATGSITVTGIPVAGTTVTYQKNSGVSGNDNIFNFGTDEYDYTVTVKAVKVDGSTKDYTIKVYRYAVGDTGPAGGWIFYIDEADEFPWTYLECAPANLGSAQWGGHGTLVEGTSEAIGTGQANTAAILAKLNGLGESNRAAQLCDSYSVNGYSDWFLPSKDELDLMYTNLAAQDTGGFNASIYWSSSENGSASAWFQSFSDGSQLGNNKFNAVLVRAVRAF
jgi:hypothetical protein